MEAERFRRAKIVCTIGPASRDPDVFRAMAAAGMDAARLNFSHASHDEASSVISLARDVAREMGRPLAVIADLQGPRIRVGTFPNGRVDLQKGQQVRLRAGTDMASPGEIYVDLLAAAEDLEAMGAD